MINMNMKQYGMNDRFVALAFMYEEEGLIVSRVISQEKDLYSIMTEHGERFAEVSGRFRHQVSAVSDYPAVGDFVMVDPGQYKGNAVIHHVLPRKSCFLRRAAGDARQEQVVAANIDTLFLCMSLNNDFNLRRLERYLSVAWDSGAIPVVVLTKADLCADPESRLAEVSSIAMGADVLVTTVAEQDGYVQILPYLTEGKTAAFLGSSGVGKSTLINCLLGEKRLDTNGLRNDDKGRHTTTRRQLILLPQGGMVVDTPGMRELGMWDAGEGISQTFADIEELAEQCRFFDCSHTSEPGCAVRRAMEEGKISESRFQSWIKLQAENEYAIDSESYLTAKERKFKEIAKYNKGKRKR